MTRSWVFLGLSITSSWGNGHATIYRALLRELTRLGHRVTFRRVLGQHTAARRARTLERPAEAALVTLPEDDSKLRRPDITKARATLGFEPRVSLEEGLVRTIESFRKGRIVEVQAPKKTGRGAMRVVGSRPR